MPIYTAMILFHFWLCYIAWLCYVESEHEDQMK